MGDEMMTTKRANRFHWHTAIFVGLFHLGAVAALFMFDWKALVVAVALWWISASLGVGMGFHRQLTHRSFKTPKLVEYFLTICGTLALEGGHILWVVTHRIHHAKIWTCPAVLCHSGAQEIVVVWPPGLN